MPARLPAIHPQPPYESAKVQARPPFNRFANSERCCTAPLRGTFPFHSIRGLCQRECGSFAGGEKKKNPCVTGEDSFAGVIQGVMCTVRVIRLFLTFHFIHDDEEDERGKHLLDTDRDSFSRQLQLLQGESRGWDSHLQRGFTFLIRIFSTPTDRIFTRCSRPKVKGTTAD